MDYHDRQALATRSEIDAEEAAQNEGRLSLGNVSRHDAVTVPLALLYEPPSEEIDEDAEVANDAERIHELAQHDLDALASEYLRRIAGIRRARERTRLAREAEIARINRRYDRVDKRDELRERMYAGLVEQMAERADFGKKAKSRTVGYGVYGRRATPDKLLVIDPTVAVVWATQHLPDAVKVERKVQLPAVKKYLKETGEVPPGFEHVPGEERPYFEVEAAPTD